MMFSNIRINKNKPVYLQIAYSIVGMINEGTLINNSKLLSTRELARTLNVSRNSCIQAYETLQDMGLIYMVRGKGAFTKAAPSNVANFPPLDNSSWNVNWKNFYNEYCTKSEELDVVKNEPQSTKGMISFKSIAPYEGLFDLDEIKRNFLDAISISHEKLLNYGYANGYKPLIDELRVYMSSKGVNLENKNILITNGFTEGFDIILSSLTNEGDTIICENPTHNTAIKLMKLHNINIIGVNIDENSINISELKSKLKTSNPKFAYLIPSYQNPTGVVMSADKRIEVYNILKQANVPIIEDGFNEELFYSASHIAPIVSISGNENGVIYIGSFSKILFPGIRIGWILADKSLIDVLVSVKRSKNIHTSTIDQGILCEYLRNGSFDSYIKKARKFYKEKYEFAIECSKKYMPSTKILGDGGLHIFVKINRINSRKLLNETIKKGVIFTPGDIFYVDDNNDEYTNQDSSCTFRLGFSRLSLDEIGSGIKIIGDVIKQLEKIN